MDAPLLNIIMTTYDPGEGSRTALACATVESLSTKILYPNVQWIIADDGSPNPDHLSKITEILTTNFHVTNAERKGVGVSKNLALNLAFESSPFVLMLEDDWWLKYPLDIFPYVKLLEQEDVSIIRLGYLGGDITARYVELCGKSYWELVRGSGVYVYSGQISLRHMRFYDVVGFHAEGLTPGEEELDMCIRYNGADGVGKVLWPADFACTFNMGPFQNIGTGSPSLNDIKPESDS